MRLYRLGYREIWSAAGISVTHAGVEVGDAFNEQEEWIEAESDAAAEAEAKKILREVKKRQLRVEKVVLSRVVPMKKMKGVKFCSPGKGRRKYFSEEK